MFWNSVNVKREPKVVQKEAFKVLCFWSLADAVSSGSESYGSEHFVS